MDRGRAGEIPGIKINGIQVTRENLKSFEKKSGKMPEVKTKKETPKVTKIETSVENKGYTKDELESIAKKDGLKGLRLIGNKLGIKFRSIIEAIKEIMEVQK